MFLLGRPKLIPLPSLNLAWLLRLDRRKRQELLAVTSGIEEEKNLAAVVCVSTWWNVFPGALSNQ